MALAKGTNKILAIGREASEMIGKTPEYIVAHRPLKDGVIDNYEVTRKMLTYFIQSTCCLLYTSPSPRDRTRSRMPSSACKKKILPPHLPTPTVADAQDHTTPAPPPHDASEPPVLPCH